MAEKQMKISFKDWYETKNNRKEINDCSWFGIVSGLCISIFCAYQSLCSIGITCSVFKVFAAIGLVLVLFGVFLPLKLKNTVIFIKKISSFVGHIILKTLILPLYFVLTLINIFKNKSYVKKFRFIQWNNESMITASYHCYKNTVKNKKKNVIFDILNSVFSVFIKNGMYILIPVVMILMILGLIMFFASSNAVFSFVYTLF